MGEDRSEGWNAAAETFLAMRSDIGGALIGDWARRHRLRGKRVLDVGCGSGAPISKALIEEGADVYGVDAAPRLVQRFKETFPQAEVACEPAQDSAFFHQRFDAAVSIGLIFLLSGDDQKTVLTRIVDHLTPGGPFIFSAPWQVCEWRDTITDRLSRSLGEDAYRRILEKAGAETVSRLTDDNGNNYFDCAKKPAAAPPDRQPASAA